MKRIIILALAVVLILGLAQAASAFSFSFGYVPLGAYSDSDWGVNYDLTAWTVNLNQQVADRFTVGLDTVSGQTAAPIDYSIQLIELYGRYDLIHTGNFSLGVTAGYAWSDLFIEFEYVAQSIYAGVALDLALTERLSVGGACQTAVWSDQAMDEFYPRVRSMASVNLRYEITPSLALSAGYVYYHHCYVEPHFTYDGYQVGLTWSL